MRTHFGWISIPPHVCALFFTTAMKGSEWGLTSLPPITSEPWPKAKHWTIYLPTITLRHGSELTYKAIWTLHSPGWTPKRTVQEARTKTSGENISSDLSLMWDTETHPDAHTRLYVFSSKGCGSVHESREVATSTGPGAETPLPEVADIMVFGIWLGLAWISRNDSVSWFRIRRKPLIGSLWSTRDWTHNPEVRGH